jgi:hypothetical protein
MARLKTSANVEVDEGGIYLKDGDEEIVCWVRDEWEEDPTVVQAIANAIVMLYEKGPDALRRSIQPHRDRND